MIVPEVLRAVFNVEAIIVKHPVLRTSLCLPYDLCKNVSDEQKNQPFHEGGSSDET